MNTTFFKTTLCSLGFALAVTGPAHAALIAGWDFSQYVSSGELSIDGATYTNVLSANYSNLDLTNGAGAESASFGTLYFDGSFGSTNVDPGSGTAALTPAPLSLASNINAPSPNPFDSFEILQAEGQFAANPLSLQIQSAVSFVFAAYTNTIPGLGSDWSVSFGGQTGTGTTTVGVEFSTDGITYVPIGSSVLTTIDSTFNLALGAVASEAAFVRFNVTPTGGATRIDNLAINGNIVVPEPGTVVLLGTALAVLAGLGRRRA